MAVGHPQNSQLGVALVTPVMLKPVVVWHPHLLLRRQRERLRLQLLHISRPLARVQPLPIPALLHRQFF